MKISLPKLLNLTTSKTSKCHFQLVKERKSTEKKKLTDPEFLVKESERKKSQDYDDEDHQQSKKHWKIEAATIKKKESIVREKNGAWNGHTFPCWRSFKVGPPPPQELIKILIFFKIFFFNIRKDTSFYNSNPKFHFIPIAVSCLKSLVCKTTSMR